jgi:copper chaperone NosL
VIAALLAFACAPAGPVAIDTQHDTCHWCRMTISTPRTAAQVVTPGEEPRLYDDLECLSNALARDGRAANATTFVTDYDSGAWIESQGAHFARCSAIETPMGSHLIARATQKKETGCEDVAAKEILR